MSPRAEAHGESSDSDFRLLADVAPVMMWRADPLGRGVWFNRPWLEFTGRRMDEELGEGWLDRIHPSDRESFCLAYAKAIERRGDFSATYRLLRHDGVYRWMLDKGRPLFTPEGFFGGLVGSCTDVTEQKQGEEKLLEALSEQAALLQEVRHRVRNNMQTVVGFASLLSRQIGAQPNMELEQMLLRIRALAHMQQHFYGSATRAHKIELSEFLRTFADDVARDVASPVRIDVSGKDIIVDVGQATSIGLAVVEAVLGGVGPHRSPREIRIDLGTTAAEASEQILISIENPSDDFTNGESEPINIRLLKLYARLIAGALEITHSKDRTRIVIRIAA